jgi:hypothetical protein
MHRNPQKSSVFKTHRAAVMIQATVLDDQAGHLLLAVVVMRVDV